MSGMPASMMPWMARLSASASGMEITMASGLVATAASINWLIATMSKVAGAW